MMKKYSDNCLQAYFTNAQDIRMTMIELLGDTTGKTLIEPCFGEGAFITNLIGKPSLIDAIDIDQDHFKNKPDIPNCNFHNLDFIDYFIHTESCNKTLPSNYDATICNPPYGLKFTKEYRKEIKNKFPNTYARESYGLFFHFTVSLLKGNGRYVFVIPDSFMTSRNLIHMRKFIINNAKPTHIIQFKSRRFESVNFGYGNMCIIAGNKNSLKNDDKIIWIDAISSNKKLSELLTQSDTLVDGKYLIDSHSDAWIHPESKNSINFSRSTVTLNDLADCKTGIYTGDNERFCGYDMTYPPKRINGHPVNWGKQVILHPTQDEKDTGLNIDNGYVPFVRGGHREPFELTRSCIRWDKESIHYYQNNKKARLQNKNFYFKKGLAIPMVTSGRLSASEMENSIFDQGVVGVFPKDDTYHDFLLLYLNQPISTKLKNIIAPGANNSANYLKKITIPSVTKSELETASIIVKKARETGWISCEKERNDFIEKIIS